MAVLPPGTLLQLMYLKERLRSVPAGRFIEIGPGSGEITRLLLDHGWAGSSYDFESGTIDSLKQRFSPEISGGRFLPVNQDFLQATADEVVKADLVISCMVMEHMDDQGQHAFMRKALQVLQPQGAMIGIVPGSPAHWGIEDDIAGHCRRYTRTAIKELVSDNGWKLKHVAGLTFPLSNFLLPLSNYLVNKAERAKLNLSLIDRTKASGRRQVAFKTHFPSLLGVVLNPVTMFPAFLIQKLFARSERALVLYFEASPAIRAQDK
ncbi:MAG: methyltransferase domain-containing protein [Ramlibacter sp.]|jgi:SAM-dependent methyltransferase|nr:methyltransferase domain-containing protein [Ramlibacter sp.]